jgi:hypothetical protein
MEKNPYQSPSDAIQIEKLSKSEKRRQHNRLLALILLVFFGPLVLLFLAITMVIIVEWMIGGWL